MRNGDVQPWHNRAPYQHQPALKSNRVGPSAYPHNNSFATPRSMVPTKPPIRTSQMYPPPQPSIDRRQSRYPNQSYYQPDYDPYDSNEFADRPVSSTSKPSCFGLTRTSGGILFGIMAFLALLSLAGLITSAVLYATDMSVDPQWKILGMVVSAVMLITVLTTFFIFIYCYKKGHLLLGKNNDSSENNLRKASQGAFPQESNQHYPSMSVRRPNHYYPSNSYGTLENVSPTSLDDNTVRVDDKQTNTERTIAALPLRDGQRGVWPGMNAYGGISRRPTEPPKMAHHVTQALPNDIDQSMTQRRNQPVDLMPSTTNRFPGDHGVEQPRSKWLAAQRPKYEMIEEIYETSRKRKPEEVIEYVELPKQRSERINQGVARPRYADVTVKHVKTIEMPDSDEDSFQTDHFYE